LKPLQTLRLHEIFLISTPRQISKKTIRNKNATASLGHFATSDFPMFCLRAYGYGAASYGLHSSRFNYLFHDNHVQTLKTSDTIGRGTQASPLGMWTMTTGD
jgi:prepilin-type processing-associated H-X9-DG protein